MRILRSHKSWAGPAIVLVATLSATGCTARSGGDGTGDQATEPAPVFTGEVPSFDGPYAAEFTEFYQDARSDFVRDVLEDEEISDAEFAEMTSRFTSCLTDQGIEFHGFQADGSMSTSLAPNGGDTHALVTECSESSGEDAINALRSFVRANPENLDASTITAECLVREGVVPEDYSADEYAQDSAGRFADYESLSPELQAALASCSADPLGVLD